MKYKKTLIDVFFLRTAREIMINILNSKKTFLLKVSSECNITFGHVVKVANKLEKEKLIYYKKEKKDGRTKYMFLTEKGRAIAEQLQKIKFLLKD